MFGINLTFVPNISRQENKSPQSIGHVRKESISQYNRGGQNGSDGSDGNVPDTVPANGVDGSAGSVQMFIKRSDGKLVGPFQSAYQLEIDDFGIVDSNEDEIFEFGETMTLQSICVKNSGYQNFLSR